MRNNEQIHHILKGPPSFFSNIELKGILDSLIICLEAVIFFFFSECLRILGSCPTLIWFRLSENA